MVTTISSTAFPEVCYRDKILLLRCSETKTMSSAQGEGITQSELTVPWEAVRNAERAINMCQPSCRGPDSRTVCVQ